MLGQFGLFGAGPITYGTVVLLTSLDLVGILRVTSVDLDLVLVPFSGCLLAVAGSTGFDIFFLEILFPVVRGDAL